MFLILFSSEFSIGFKIAIVLATAVKIVGGIMLIRIGIAVAEYVYDRVRETTRRG